MDCDKSDGSHCIPDSIAWRSHCSIHRMRGLRRGQATAIQPRDSLCRDALIPSIEAAKQNFDHGSGALSLAWAR